MCAKSTVALKCLTTAPQNSALVHFNGFSNTTNSKYVRIFLTLLFATLICFIFKILVSLSPLDMIPSEEDASRQRGVSRWRWASCRRLLPGPRVTRLWRIHLQHD